MTLPAVVFTLLQSHANADGGISSISQIISRLKRHRPVIVTDRETDRVRNWRNSGIEVHVIPQRASSGISRNFFGALGSYARYAVGLHRVIRRSGARVIHGNDPLAFQLSLAPARMAGAKILLNLRDTLDPDRAPPRRRYRFLFDAADHILYLSRDMAHRWTHIAADTKKACSVTYSIVDAAKFAPGERPETDPPVVLLSGVIRAKKGQLEFLRRVSPMLAAKGIATWLAGDFDPQKSAYMRQCAQAASPLGDMVSFLGYRADLPHLFARCSAVAIASKHEGLVRAMTEAMSCSRPVVSFNIASAREILIDEAGGAGIVVANGDYEAMAQALAGYCADPKRAAAAGAKGRETALRLFAAEDVVRRYEDAYESLRSS